MEELHTIVTNNSRKLYFPYYLMFLAILGVCSYLFLTDRLVLSALGAAAIMVFLGVNATEIHRLYEGYEVNPSAVVHTKGLISKKSRRIDLFAINTVSVHQTLFQRLLNLGDIHVHVANASHVTSLKNLHAPKVFAQTIQNNMHKARHKDFPEEKSFSLKQPSKRLFKDGFTNDNLSENSDDFTEI